MLFIGRARPNKGVDVFLEAFARLDGDVRALMVGDFEGEALREVTWVTINEIESGSWGIGGQPLTTQAVHSLQEAV